MKWGESFEPVTPVNTYTLIIEEVTHFDFIITLTSLYDDFMYSVSSLYTRYSLRTRSVRSGPRFENISLQSK